MSKVPDAVVQRRTIQNLRSDLGSEETDHIADLLELCSAELPCCSGACRRCLRDLQTAGIAMERDHIQGVADRTMRGRTGRATLIPVEGWAAPGELDESHLEAVREATFRALELAKIPRAICGIEVSYNEDQTGEVPDHWQAHSCLIVPDWLSEEQQKHFTVVCPGERAVFVERLDERDEGPAYAFKPERERRVTVLNTTHPTRQPFRDTKGYELRPWQRVILATAEHRFGLGRHQLIVGITLDEVKRSIVGLEWLMDELEVV